MEINIKDFENSAKQILDKAVYSFFSGGANDEITLKENEDSFKKIQLLPKVLHGIQDPNTEVVVLGQKLKMPIIVAPMAFQKLCHPNGEFETASAVQKANALMTVSTYSMTPLQKIIAISSIRPWFQLYILKDRILTKNLIEFIEDAGCSAIVITVDAPFYGRREREIKNPLKFEIELPDFCHIAKKLSTKFELNDARSLSKFLDNSITWKDIEWVKSITKLPIILKGILREDDAEQAVNLGIKGIIISNHGGRQLDTSPPAIRVLPKFKKVLNDNVELFIDGGLRRGTDILKALALGANAVLIGRPIVWGLSVKGALGVYEILELLNQELKLAMALCGSKRIQDITSDIILEY